MARRKVVAKPNRKRVTYPKAVCVVDIETARTDLKRPELSEIAVVGTLVFRRTSGKWNAGKYRGFLAHEMEGLRKVLESFDGIIVGHNIFDFDLRVLSRHMPLQQIIPRTVDTLAALFKPNKSMHDGLSLDDLCRYNLGIAKSIQGRVIPKLWAAGRRKEVIRYNQNDCKMTFLLWNKLVTRRWVCIVRRRLPPWDWNKDWYVDIKKPLINELLGERPRFRYAKWAALLEHERPSRPFIDWARIRKELVDPHLEMPPVVVAAQEARSYLISPCEVGTSDVSPKKGVQDDA